MRPIDRGPSPENTADLRRKFREYKDATPFLRERIGEWCSYCERAVSPLSLEHIQPKSLYPEKTLSWDNFLLACHHCNSKKGVADINDENISDYCWPDRDNTFLFFDYSLHGMVRPAPNLTPEDQKRAERMIDLLNLNPESPGDCRFRARYEAMNHALLAQDALQKSDTDYLRHLIICMMQGHFSIWLYVFRDDADLRRRILAKFTGTAMRYFDENSDATSPERNSA